MENYIEDTSFLVSSTSKKMCDKITEFIYDGSLQKRHKKLQDNVFVLYLSKRIKLRPGEFINVDMKLSVHTHEQIIAACILLPTLTKNGLCMESYQYMSSNNNKNSICNTHQLVNSPWKIHFELINRSTNTLFFNMQKTRNLFIYYLKRWSGRIKSQIYKDIKIF